MRGPIALTIVMLSTATAAAQISGTYVSDIADCKTKGPLSGIVVSAIGLEQSEVFCPAREWHHVKAGYRSLCVVDEVPLTITFSLTPQSDGSLLYKEPGATFTLHRCR